MTYQVDENGFYGAFGGAYIPEILYKTVEDLKKAYLPIHLLGRKFAPCGRCARLSPFV